MTQLIADDCQGPFLYSSTGHKKRVMKKQINAFENVTADSDAGLYGPLDSHKGLDSKKYGRLFVCRFQL